MSVGCSLIHGRALALDRPAIRVNVCLVSLQCRRAVFRWGVVVGAEETRQTVYVLEVDARAARGVHLVGLTCQGAKVARFVSRGVCQEEVACVLSSRVPTVRAVAAVVPRRARFSGRPDLLRRRGCPSCSLSVGGTGSALSTPL